jgi:hypothetical protein
MKPTKFAALRRRATRPVEVTAPEVKVRFDLTELLAEGSTQRAHEALRTAGADLDRGIITTYPDPADPAKVLVVWREEDLDEGDANTPSL